MPALVACRERRGPGPERETPVVRAFQRASPAVVNLRVQSAAAFSPAADRPAGGERSESSFHDFLEEDLGGPDREWMGSGILIDPRGLVLTNEHVILGASAITVGLADGREFAAEVLGADPLSDLAVLRLDRAGGLPFVNPGNSSDLMIGEPVIAIGNPYGLGHTLTTGVISSLHRPVKVGGRTYENLIQTDASINPGNSGGPLLNIRGELIGITTAIYQQAQGIGFATPVDRARQVVDDLILFGEVRPGWLDFEIAELGPAERFGLDYPGPGGVLVVRVQEGGPAARAGVRPGDVLEALQGRAVADSSHYRRLMSAVTVGDRVEAQLFREGRLQSVSLEAADFPLELADELIWKSLGLLAAERPTPRGGEGAFPVVIARVDPAGPAGRVGVAPGDAVRRVGRTPIGSLAQFRQVLSNGRFQESAVLLIQRGDYGYYISLLRRTGAGEKVTHD